MEGDQSDSVADVRKITIIFYYKNLEESKPRDDNRSQFRGLPSLELVLVFLVPFLKEKFDL